MELTVENVFKLLDSRNYTTEYLNQDNSSTEKKFNLQDYTDTVKLLLDSFWPGYRIKHIEDVGPVGGPITSLNDLYINKVFKDVTRLDIHNLYPYTIYKLNNVKNQHQEVDPYNEEEWETNSFFKNKLLWNIDQFPILFNFLFDQREIIKSMSSSDDQRVYILLKVLFNYTWGAINNKYSFIKCRNSADIMNTIRSVETYMIDTFSKHIIYLNTDSIYFSAFPEIEENIINKFNELEYDFDITSLKYFLPITRLNYLTSNFDIQVRGLKIISNLREYLDKREKILETDKEKKIWKDTGVWWPEDSNLTEARTKLPPINMKIDFDGLSYIPAQTIGLDLVEVKPTIQRPKAVKPKDDWDDLSNLFNFDD